MTALLVRTELTPVGVGVLTLDDPDRRNALSLPMVEQIVAAMDAFERNEAIGAVVVTGAGPAFCAGADLGDLRTAGEDNLRRIYDGFLRIARSPLPTLAAVNGPAVGAGMNLALACDLRIMGKKGRFDTRFLDLGLHPGGGHTWMLTRIAGTQAAAAAVLFGQRLTGEEAVAAGLAWRAVDDERLLPESIDVAGRAASTPRELAIRVKETLRRVATVETHDEAVDVEIAAQLWSVQQPFFAERLAALQAKVSSKHPK